MLKRFDDIIVELRRDPVSDENKKEYCQKTFEVSQAQKKVFKKDVNFTRLPCYCFHISETLCTKENKFSTELNVSALEIFDDEELSPEMPSVALTATSFEVYDASTRIQFCFLCDGEWFRFVARARS